MRITPGAVVKGGTSLGYKTGRWRDQRPVIRRELCKPCGVCEIVCPDSAVYAVDKIYAIDYDYCKGCALCAHECPTKAIVMEPEER
jgi:2-oxoacid:acceptor oxidoreductase delta subunit (pyruvate/2-ketoisovalerate family)